ncbi:hypothetical protein AAUPMB_21402, partial [Pasteurella multocida subsp. multocida str. Anand1_buffalo]
WSPRYLKGRKVVLPVLLVRSVLAVLLDTKVRYQTTITVIEEVSLLASMLSES